MSVAKPTMPGTFVELAPSVLARLFASIEQDLSDVTSRLKNELRHDDPSIDEIARHSFRIGGKRLRPALLLLAGQATGEINESHRVLATVVEMIHTATLVHDDVLDEAELRRHEATVRARWDNQASVLLGDYLFTHAFYLASTLETTFGCRSIGRATNIVCEGELKQTVSSGEFDLSRENYFDIIEAKTAELCACCCRLGAYYSGADEEVVESLEAYGRHLGIAFQIADDLLDLEGQEQLTGKSLGTDLSKQKMTLPLIYLRDGLAPEQRGELAALVEHPSSENGVRLLEWLDESGALQHSRAVAADHMSQALAKLDKLPSSSARESLSLIAQFVANREC